MRFHSTKQFIIYWTRNHILTSSYQLSLNQTIWSTIPSKDDSNVGCRSRCMCIILLHLHIDGVARIGPASVPVPCWLFDFRSPLSCDCSLVDTCVIFPTQEFESSDYLTRKPITKLTTTGVSVLLYLSLCSIFKVRYSVRIGKYTACGNTLAT